MTGKALSSLAKDKGKTFVLPAGIPPWGCLLF
jgi:hypothetical protein